MARSTKKCPRGKSGVKSHPRKNSKRVKSHCRRKSRKTKSPRRSTKKCSRGKIGVKSHPRKNSKRVKSHCRRKSRSQKSRSQKRSRKTKSPRRSTKKCPRGKSGVKSHPRKNSKRVKSHCRRNPSSRKTRSRKSKKCPQGKRYVNPFRRSDGTYVKGFCAKKRSPSSSTISSKPSTISSVFTSQPTVQAVPKKDESFLTKLAPFLGMTSKGREFLENQKKLHKEQEARKNFQDTMNKIPRLTDSTSISGPITKERCMSAYSLQPGYTPEQARQKFRQLSLRYHPDKLQPGDNPNYFAELVLPCRDKL